MQKILTIAKKELGWYFNTPVGYVLLGLFAALANFLVVRDVLLRQQADLSALFVLLPWLLMVLIAAVCARAIAEEKKSGTLEVLLTLPIKKSELILGKFLGLGIFGLIAILTTLPVVGIVALLGNPDIGVIIAGYLASFLFALSLLSIGIFISTTSTNQVAAVFISIIVFFVIMVIGNPIITDQVPRVARNAFFFISPVARYESMARGVVDLRDVVYFASVVMGFLYLSVETLKRSN
jgi:ABC-2 type transport system permease protein